MSGIITERMVKELMAEADALYGGRQRRESRFAHLELARTRRMLQTKTVRQAKAVERLFNRLRRKKGKRGC